MQHNVKRLALTHCRVWADNGTDNGTRISHSAGVDVPEYVPL